MQIEYREIEKLTPYVNNSRTHSTEQIEQIKASIKEYGYTNPLLIDEEGNIIAGHGRLEASRELNMKEVPCIVLRGLTEAQKKAYIIADNKMALNAGWNEELLKQELLSLQDLDFNLELTGFSEEELGTLLAEEIDDDEIIEDAVPEIPEEPKAKLGDIYKLGKHRLMCGDSTNASDVEKLMEKDLADLVVTDPPYNVDIGIEDIEEAKIRKRRTDGLVIKNDKMDNKEFYQFLLKAFKNLNRSIKPGGVFYIWYASKEVVNFSNALEDAELPVRQELIWNKNSLVMGRQDYQWKHEPCLYGWKEGAGHYFIDDRTQTTVFEDKGLDFKKMKKEELVELLKEIYSDKTSTTIINEDRPTVSDLHPTMKPLKLLARQIKNSSKPGEKVLDIFGGSGSTLMTCEQLGRKCYMMEYDPHYVDVIIERWEKFTGDKAEKI